MNNRQDAKDPNVTYLKSASRKEVKIRKKGIYASMLPQKSRTFLSVSRKNRNMPKRLANQI